jgi:hypothetical protein
MLTLKYLDTCLPDYFNGFGGEVFAVPVDGDATYQDVLDGLHSEINSWSGYMDSEQAKDTAWDELHASADEMFKVNAPVHLDKTWSRFAEDGCYAYFGVMVEED